MDSKKSIVLANPPLPYRDGRSMVPLGLASLHGSLVQAGYENAHMIDAERDGLDTMEAMVRRIRELVGDKLDFIGVGVLPAALVAAKDMIATVRDEFDDPEVCVGGYLPTSFGAQTLDHLNGESRPDYVVGGRGETALLDILEHGKARPIPNVITTHASGEILDGGREPVDISNLAWATRENLENGGHVMINRLLGCPGRCTFCTVHKYARDSKGRKINQRPPADFVGEISHLYHEYGTTGFDIVDDDAFGDNPEEWHDIMDEMDQQGLKGKINFWLLTRLEAVVNNPELIKRMAEYGMTSTYCGLESLNERQLKLYAKMSSRLSTVDYPTFLQQAASSLQILKENGVIPKYGFIPFDAEVTPDEVRENIALARELGLLYYVSELTKRLSIYRGSAIQRQYRRKGYLTEPVGDNDEAWLVQRYSYRFQHPAIERLRSFLNIWARGTYRARLFTKGVNRKRFNNPDAPESKAAWDLYKALRDIEASMVEEILTLAENGASNEAIMDRLGHWMGQYNEMPGRFY